VQSLLDGIAAGLKAFINQRDEIALIVRCRDEECPVILKTFEGLDEGAESEMFWIASDEFTDAGIWVTSVVNDFVVKHGAVRMAMGKEGFTPWPALPDQLLDATRRPALRLRELMEFSRTLRPFSDGMLTVWCFVPLEIADARGWAALMWELLQHEFPNPWCHHTRIFARGTPAEPFLQSALASIPRIAWYDPDLSQAAIHRALEEEAADRTFPLELRLQNLFMSAGVDYGHGRFEQALAKYGILLKFYTGVRNPGMTAMVLNAIGETHARTGNADAAMHCFEQALVPASSMSPMPIPVMLNVTLNLANQHMAFGHWEEAEAYYDASQKLAMVSRDANTRLRSIENLGVCLYAQGKVTDAVAKWHAGASVADELGMSDPRRTMLLRLAGHYHQTQDYAAQAEMQRLADASPSGAAPASRS
jgi:tetratricopeptide (TPR) repeat protein